MPHLTTTQVLQQHIDAVKERNLNDIARDYAEDAVFIAVSSNSEGKLEKSFVNGKEPIKALFQSVFTNVLTSGSSMEFTNKIVEGEVAYITWSARSTLFIIPAATDTFLIKDGKIVLQTGFTILNPLS